MKLIPDKFNGLIARLSLFVGTAVFIVASIILAYATSQLKTLFEEHFRLELTEAIDATTNAVDLYLTTVESAVNTAAAFGGEDAQNLQLADSILTRSLLCQPNLYASTIIYDKKTINNTDKFYQTYVHRDENSHNFVSSNSEIDISNDQNWIYSYQQGKPFWSPPYTDIACNKPLICYSVPITNNKGQRYGIFAADMTIDWFTEEIIRQKMRKDFDITIVDKRGQEIVPPTDEIRRLAPEELLTETRDLKRLGWTFIYRIPRSVMRDKVYFTITNIAIVIFILLVTILATIVLSVRYVARPFVRHQTETAKGKAVLEQELRIASSTQHELVPHTFPAFPDNKEIDLHAFLQPARDVGGDLYDYFIEDGNLYFCIGDVSGKGVPAALFMAATHYLFRSVAVSPDGMDHSIERMNQSLCADNSTCMFVTFFFGRLNLTTGDLYYINAGHNSPFIITHNDVRPLPPADDTPLGIWDEAEFTICHTQLQQGESILLYTDGVTEAMNSKKEVFGDKATIDCIATCHKSEPKQIIDTVINSLKQHAQDEAQSDDITMLCIRRNNP